MGLWWSIRHPKNLPKRNFCVLRPHCPQPEVGPGRHAHQEKEESSLRGRSPMGSVERGIAVPWTSSLERWLTNSPRTFNPCWAGGSPGSPRHTTTSGSTFRSSGQLRHPAGLHTSSVPHLRLSMMQMDHGVGQELLIHNSVHIRQTFWSAHCVDVIKESHDVFTTTQPRLRVSLCEEYGHEEVALLPSLPFWNMLCDTQLRQPLSSSLHPLKITTFRRLQEMCFWGVYKKFFFLDTKDQKAFGEHKRLLEGYKSFLDIPTIIDLFGSQRDLINCKMFLTFWKVQCSKGVRFNGRRPKSGSKSSSKSKQHKQQKKKSSTNNSNKSANS